MLHLAGDYAVIELKVRSEGWLANRTLADLDLADEGILVLGVSHGDGTYTGVPNGELRLLSGDTVLLYGRSPALVGLDKRGVGAGGDASHDIAVAEQNSIEDGSKMIESRPIAG